ncbi:MAG: DUF3048 domain-containing protein [Bacillota bacterium]|nr:DUF3048 domain-containing protein [Bacillota bacterium]
MQKCKHVQLNEQNTSHYRIPGRRSNNLTRIAAVFITVVLLLSAAGCAGPETSLIEDTTPEITTTRSTTETSRATETSAVTETSAAPETSLTTESTTTATETSVIPNNHLNFMTGEVLADPDAPKQRPMAFMVNNTKIGTPQIGTSEADLIFETEIEGGVTRMMAVYTDVSKVPELGSLRSLRHNFIDLASGLDAIIVHVGSSYAAEAQLDSQGTKSINLQVYPSAWWRDEIWWKERGKEHSVKTTSERMTVALERSGIRKELRANQASFSLFNEPGKRVRAQGEVATLVTIPFSGYNKTTLTWDDAIGLYSKGEYGKPQLDLATGEPLRFSNALILLTSITSFDGGILRQIDLSSGKGYYVSAGYAEPITWKKGDTNDPFVFYTADGNQLVMNTGKTYIAIVSNKRTISFNVEA